MGDVEAFTFFCEDVRWEASGSPMFIGVLAPSIASDDFPIDLSIFQLVTFFRAKISVQHIKAHLVLNKISRNGESSKLRTLIAEFERDEAEESDFQWIALSTLPLDDIRLASGESIQASLNVSDCSWDTYLSAGNLSVSVTDGNILS